ncbi:MAG: DNA-3-methyladenine glycosylase I [bacterium]|nr:DNA-3-methyladenine glycosylase I [bacterium]MCP4966647.1 DNA-3-methyladenine glycosylase I [bacterium]
MIEVITGDDGVPRCSWGDSPDIYRVYHDEEWGQPIASDQVLFEKLCLEGFQAGLSWLTILNRREGFRAAFHGFDIDKVADMTETDVETLVQDTSIIRHRGKIESTINNANRAQEVITEFGSFGALAWSYEPDCVGTILEPTTPESTAFSKDLKKRGFSFVGPTTAYAFMQAMGIVNDHLPECHAWETIDQARARFIRPR